MDELDRVRELLSEQPPPTRRSKAKARAQLLELAGQPRRRSARTSAFRLFTATAATVAVAALLLGPVYLYGGLGRPGDGQATGPTSSSPSGRATVVSAKSILLGAARQLDTMRPEPPGKYWRVRSEIVVPYPNGTKADHEVEERRLEEMWLRRSPVGGVWLGYCELGLLPVGAADETTKAGDCGIRKGDSGVVTLWGPESLDQLDSIPTDVEGLRAYLLESRAVLLAERAADDMDPDRWLFSAASSLLAEVPTSPQVRAAAFRLLAGLPGVVSQGTVRDSLGREGTAIALVDNSGDIDSTLQLVVDPVSGTLLSQRLNAVTAKGEPVKRVTVLYLSVGWTNDKPRPPTPDD